MKIPGPGVNLSDGIPPFLTLYNWNSWTTGIPSNSYTNISLPPSPLRVDTVIIKKPPEIHIDKNFARIFKEFNLVEYKSPEDYLSINDFYKVYGYACLYAALNNVSITGLTLT
jgi:hypothetical protein